MHGLEAMTSEKFGWNGYGLGIGQIKDKVLIFVCGPNRVVETCRDAALEFNAHFVSESFEF